MLIIILLLILWIGSTLLYGLLPLSPWFWFLYPVLGLLSTAIIFAIIFGILMLMFKIQRHDNRFKHAIAWHFVDLIRIFLRLKVEVEGRENIPQETFVVYGNHKSMADIIVVYYAYHRVMSAVAKNNLLKVPVLRQLMDYFAVVPMNRENEREGVKDLIKAIQLVKDGYNMLIFPEGGIKSREVETMVGFKAGAFKLATKADATISPISIIGSTSIPKNFPKRKSVIKIVIHKPITKDEYANINTFELGEQVREIIDQGVIEHQK